MTCVICEAEYPDHKPGCPLDQGKKQESPAFRVPPGTPQQALENMPPPICPHCSLECMLAGRGVEMGGIPWIVVSCTGCRKMITVVAMPVVPPGMLRGNQVTR